MATLAHSPADADAATDTHEPVNALWRYVPSLRREDEIWRLRLIAHDFGMVWEDPEVADRKPALVAREPGKFDQRWDAFLAAFVEHRCIEDGLDPPAWTQHPDRFLPVFWYVCGCDDFDRVRTIVTTPITFEAHGIWIPREELAVV